MKKLALLLLSVSLCFSLISYASMQEQPCILSEEAVKLATFGHIDAKGLKSLMDSQADFLLLDARGDKWNDPHIIPGAIQASAENSALELDVIIPHADTLIVVYGFSSTCPKSTRLAEKLVLLGYRNIIKYSAGLQEWRNVANYPVETIQR